VSPKDHLDRAKNNCKKEHRILATSTATRKHQQGLDNQRCGSERQVAVRRHFAMTFTLVTI